MISTNRSRRFNNYAITAESESVLDFRHPSASFRRQIWTALTGDCNYVPAPYLPTASRVKLHSSAEMPCIGSLAVVQQLSNLSGFAVDDDALALCDGITGLLIRKKGNEYKIVDTTALDFTDHWYETDTGVVGMTSHGIIKRWFCHNNEMPLMPRGFRHVGHGSYIHNSLRISTTSPYQAELWAELHDEDMNDGRPVIVNWRQDEFTVMDATAPDRRFRMFQKLSDGEVEEWAPIEKELSKPMPENAVQDPYNLYVQTIYHVPLCVVGKPYPVQENFHLCVGATRTNPHCKEVYILRTNGNVWARLSNWNEEHLERKFIPPNALVSFRFQRSIGWVVNGVRHIRV